MAKPRRPRGPHSGWEPKIVPPGVPEPAHTESGPPAPEFPASDAPAAPAPETEISERALMAAADPSPEPVLPETMPAEAVHPETSAFEASFEASRPDLAAEPSAALAQEPAADLAPAPADPVSIPSEPAPALVAGEPAAPTVVEAPAQAAPSAPAPRHAGFGIAFAPERFDMVGIGDVIAGYMRGEAQAAAAHVRALADTRSPAELIRLQVGEMQRAADASLTCWSTVAHKAGRAFALA